MGVGIITGALLGLGMLGVAVLIAYAIHEFESRYGGEDES